MIDAMKDIQKFAEEKGFQAVKYDEFEHRQDEDYTKRYLFVFEEAE